MEKESEHLKKNTTRKAVSVAIIKNNKILILQRSKTHKVGSELWQLPGGKVGENESNDHAAYREIKNEIGIELNLRKLIYIRDFVDMWILDVKEDLFVMALYVFFIDKASLDVYEKYQSYKWIPIQELFDCKLTYYFSSTPKYLQFIRRYILTHLPLYEIALYIKENLNTDKPLPKKINGVPEESLAVIYSLLSVLGFVSDKGDYFPASTLSHQLINLLSEWALTDGVVFEAIDEKTKLMKKNSEDKIAVAKYREGLFDHHSNLLGILSYKLPKALSSRRVASLLIFGKCSVTNERLLLVRWDFLANKYQIPSKGLEDIETDFKDIETAKSVVEHRLNKGMIDEFKYQYFTKIEFQRVGAGSLGLVQGDGPMLRSYFISFFKLFPQQESSNKIVISVDNINKSTIEYLRKVDNFNSLGQDIKRDLHFYMWVSFDRIINDPEKIVGELFQGFADLMDNVSLDELLENDNNIDVFLQDYTPITYSAENSNFDHKSDLRELYANRII